MANSESVLLKISANALKVMFREAPALAAPFLLGLSRTLAGRIRHLTKRFEAARAPLGVPPSMPEPPVIEDLSFTIPQEDE